MNELKLKARNAWFAALAMTAIATILAFTAVMTVSAQSDTPEWRLPVTGLTAVAGDDPGEMILSWDAHTQTTKTLLNYRVAWTLDGDNFKSADQTDWNTHTTGNQHTVTGLDAGATYQVKVRTRYEGNQGSRWTEVVTGQSAVAPNSPANGQPTIAGTLETGETLTAATSSISDDNGLANAAFTYQWIHTTTDSEAYIPAATASSYLLSSDDLGHSIKVRVTFTDDDGYTERLTSSATALVIMQTNVAATGQPTITGSAEVGETLTAATSAISDSNGITNAVFSHQWVRSANGSDNDITDATGSTYVITNADIDKAIKVRVSFTDDDGYSETLTSNATTSVPVPAPVIVPPEEPQIAQAAGDDDEPVVLDTWSLKPSGLSVGDQFRLIFLSSTKRNAVPTSIGTYNTWIQARAAAGHEDIQAYSDGFTVVGCTAAKDARDNTATTYTSSDKGVPIYWLGGNKVADEYDDFYDGSWDNESNSQDRNELGINSIDTSTLNNRPFTGCDHNGTERILTTGSVAQSRALGKAFVRVGRLNSSISSEGPLNGGSDQDEDDNRPMYGLSAVFTIVDQLPPITLVSNAGQTLASQSVSQQSQPFTTGSNLGGYTLTSVDVGLGGTADSRTRLFHIVPNQSNGQPDLSDSTKFITLTTPSSLSSNSLNTFTAPAGAKLAANTTYHLYLASADGGVPGNIQRVSSQDEDDGGAPGWSIGNIRYWRDSGSGSWNLNVATIVRMRIIGRNALPSTDAKLSALVIEGATSGESISLSPAFAAGTLTYTAEVAYGIDTVTLTATTNHSGATVAIADDDDAITKNEADLDLSGGVNTLTVTVTAEDTTTTETYTITVTRGSTDATLSSLMIQDTANGETVDLNPAFVADTLAYTARVAHSINVVTLTATTNQSGAMVAITDDDDANTKNKADLDIDVGANTLTVTVTAEDTTTETYTVTVTRAQDPTVPPTVPPTWSLVPSGLSDGDQFRLLFVSAIRLNGSSSDIADYNTFVQEQAAAGHTDIQTYSNRFKAVGCTEAVDARDNTGTTYTSTDKGVPIYWLNGNKVADDYEDFYDESWDDEAASKNELGTASYNISQAGNRPLTGCDDDGTESFVSSQSRALGNGGDITVARPNSSGTGDGPLSSGQKIDKTFTRPMYALSQVFTVTAPADCPTDATWCTTMGVRNTTTTTSLAKYEFSGYNITGRNGTLGSTTFLHESTDYTVSRLEQTTFTVLPANTLSFRTFFLKAEPPLPTDTILKLGNRSFTVGDESAGETFGQEEWDTEDNPLNWTNRQNVTVSLTLPDDGQTNHVPSNWSLKPNGLTSGDEFRLLFLSSTKRKATPSDIAVYNAWIQDLAADGHADILTYSSGFTAVGCTEDTDARDNTSTTYTVIERGAPIYWLDGDLVAVDYADFYDGTWQDETNPKNESGTNGPDTSVSDNYPITGCNHNGTEDVVSGNSLALGSAPIRVAVPGVSNPGTGPLSSSSNLAAPTANRPMYGLSAVFIVTETSTDATLSDLTIEGITNGETVLLQPTFKASNFTYKIAVSNGIDHITVIATTNDNSATVVIAADDDASTSNEAEMALNVGDNTLTFTVTAEDTSVTQTYTLTVTRTEPRPEPTQIPITWSLIPDGLGINDEFRLLFVSSTKRTTGSTYGGINGYNNWIKDRVAAGHTDIQAYKSNFKVVGCTTDDDARDNTGTTYTADDKGVPIYWLTGNKVVDDYDDFYDGNWDDEANNKDETGTNGLNLSVILNYPATGCDHDGTVKRSGGTAFALSTPFPALGRPNSSDSDAGPLSSGINTALERPMYGLSGVFKVSDPADATLNDLTIQGVTNGQTSLLRPTFKASTFTYTIAVSNGIDQITVTATTNDSDATVVIDDDDDTSTPNTADLNLNVGDNTLTFTVTAEDTSVTQTYTLTVTRTEPRPEPTQIPITWSLIPDGLGINDEFRLLFVSSTKRTTGSTYGGINGYNNWIKDRVAAGHTDIQAYKSNFKVVGCTTDDDARDNTGTTYTADDKGVPIYWLTGNKVVDDYDDFYDGNWDDEANNKDETGTNGLNLSVILNYPATGCDHDGTVKRSGGTAFALSTPFPALGRPNSSDSDAGPLSSGINTALERPMYGLSGVFKVSDPADATLNDLTIQGVTNGQTSLLRPTFKASTFTYTIAVSNGIDQITVTATTNDSDATVVIDDDDDTSTPNTADLNLNVGDNTLTFTVTAEDTSVTQTYTLTVTRTEPRPEPTQIPITWSLIPDGLGINDEFRLLFVSSTKRTTGSTYGGINGYNNWIKDRVAAGHTDIQAYKSNFKVVGCTTDDDARDNTGTTYTADDKGVPIYWLTGNKVVDDYDDFYDGNWDDEANNKDETGTNGLNLSVILNYPATGCDHDGTVKRSGGTAFALSTPFPALGRPNSSDSDAGPLSSGINTALERPMYGLSTVFKVTDPSDATLSDLAIEGTTNGETVELDPPFDEDTLTYTAAVGHRIDEVKLTVTSNNDNATIVIAGDDDTSTSNEAEMDLNVGSNTLTITVTAEDTTTLTYTVTLRRARQTAPDAPTGLMATANGTSDINLEWTEPAYNGDNAISGYKIEYSANGNSDWTVLLADTGSADTTYSDASLDPRTTRHYRVFAINSIGTGPKSNIANATTDARPTPAQVTGVNVTPSNGALSVRWTAVSDATGYKVRWKSGGQNYNAGREASITSGSTNNYTISGLNNGTQYLVTVIATKTGANDGPPSLETSGTPSPIPPSVTFGPGSFTASENGATATVTVELSVPAADDVTIPLRVQHRNGATSADYSGVPRRLIFEDGNTIRSFTVAAVDDSENDDGEKIKIEFYDLPAGFPAGARSSITVKLKDNDGGNSLPLFDPANELRDLVENTPANQNVGLPITATDADGDSLSYTFSGPDMDRFTFVPATAQLRTKSGQTYDYETHELFVVRVTADDGNGGTKTATVVISVRDVDEPPQAPTNLTLVQAYPTSMALSWTPPDNTGRPVITGYDLQYKKSNETTWTAGLQGITETSDSITDLDPSTSYHVQVRANNDEGNGTWSSTLAHSTPSVSPGVSITKTNLTVTEGDQTGVTYLIVLGSEPTADITVYLSGYSDSTVAPHRPATVFNTGNWNAPREVRLRTIEDADTTDETVTITHAVTSSDADYNGIAVPNLTVTIIDNDTPQVTRVWTQPGDRQLTVNWTAADKATGYKVQWKAPGDNYNTNARMATITSGTTTSYTIPNLTNGTEYTVLVTATWTDHSDGPRSDEATGTPTATP